MKDTLNQAEIFKLQLAYDEMFLDVIGEKRYFTYMDTKYKVKLFRIAHNMYAGFDSRGVLIKTENEIKRLVNIDTKDRQKLFHTFNKYLPKVVIFRLMVLYNLYLEDSNKEYDYFMHTTFDILIMINKDDMTDYKIFSLINNNDNSFIFERITKNNYIKCAKGFILKITDIIKENGIVKLKYNVPLKEYELFKKYSIFNMPIFLTTDENVYIYGRDRLIKNNKEKKSKIEYENFGYIYLENNILDIKLINNMNIKFKVNIKNAVIEFNITNDSRNKLNNILNNLKIKDGGVLYNYLTKKHRFKYRPRIIHQFNGLVIAKLLNIGKLSLDIEDR